MTRASATLFFALCIIEAACGGGGSAHNATPVPACVENLKS